MTRALPLVLLAATLLVPADARAQRFVERFDRYGYEDGGERESLVVELAKWSSGGLAIAAGALAIIVQGDAEDRLEELERYCLDNRVACSNLTPDGAYADPELEARYQDIRQDFRDSRMLLVGANLLAVTSLVLFIVDLPHDPQPENVPYDPNELRFGVRPDGAFEASFRYPVSNILTRSP